MSSLGNLFAKHPRAPRKDTRPFARRLSRYEPRGFRGENQLAPSPADVLPQYKAPSVFADHKAIVIIFGILCLALAAYWIKSVRAAPRPAPPPVQAVYVDMVPPPAGPAPPSAGKP